MDNGKAGEGDGLSAIIAVARLRCWLVVVTTYCYYVLIRVQN